MNRVVRAPPDGLTLAFRLLIEMNVDTSSQIEAFSAYTLCIERNFSVFDRCSPGVFHRGDL